MLTLPRIMVAPNGARRTKADHARLPVTIDETVDTCRACAGAGATGAHLHVRDDGGLHSLDADLYKQLLDKIDTALPDFFCQITTETAGRFSAQDQRDLLMAVKPKSASVALREFAPDATSLSAARDSYHWASENGVFIHHICYDPSELSRLLAMMADGIIPGTHHHVQLVIGSYGGSKISNPNDIEAFAAPLIKPPKSMSFDWMVCAFGTAETACLVRTINLGGKARIGFENSLWNRNGRLATNNAQRVANLVTALNGSQTIAP